MEQLQNIALTTIGDRGHFSRYYILTSFNKKTSTFENFIIENYIKHWFEGEKHFNGFEKDIDHRKENLNV
jgi:hypothetical protein